MAIDDSWANAKKALSNEIPAAPSYACPVCQGKVVWRCKCFVAESKCENGHLFHKGENGEWVVGEGDHGPPKMVLPSGRKVMTLQQTQCMKPLPYPPEPEL